MVRLSVFNALFSSERASVTSVSKPEVRLALFFLRESRFYGSGVLAKVFDAEMREFYASHKSR